MKKSNKILLTILIVLLVATIVVELFYTISNKKKSDEKIGELERKIQVLNANTYSSQELQKSETKGSKPSTENVTLNNVQENQTQSEKVNVDVTTIKNVSDAISDNDTKTVKAQKIAKEVMNAVNNSDWYYLAKMVGKDADYFIKYGIKNYKINMDTCKYVDDLDEYTFNEEYDWDKTKIESLKDVGLGKTLIIKFDEGGKIVIDPLCTGIY